MSPAGVSMFYGAFDKDTALKFPTLDFKGGKGNKPKYFCNLASANKLSFKLY